MAALLHALLVWAAFPPIDLWPLIALAPLPLAWVAVRAPSPGFAVLAAIGAQSLLWLWISRWMMAVTAVGFPFYAITMAVIGGGLFTWLFRQIHAEESPVARLPMALTLPVLWVSVEVLRGEFIFDGYPWYFLAHPVVEAPILAQSADLFGAYFISYLAAMISGTALDFARWRRSERHSRTMIIVAAVTVVLHGANLGYGAWRMNESEVLNEELAVLVVQTNIPSDNKVNWTPKEKVRQFHAFLQQTKEAYDAVRERGKPVDVIVWPETTLPGFGIERDSLQYLFDNGYEVEYHFADQIVAAQAALSVPMLIGSHAVLGLGTEEVIVDGEPRLQWTWRAQYNSAYLLEGDPPFQRYDKLYLTPFGETMPYISNWPALEQRLLAIGARGMRFDLDAGDEPRILRLPWRGGEARLATPICFEATSGWLNRRLVWSDARKRADVLVNLTNDGWFGFHAPGRVQHAQISRYRAIENRVPMVRAANTGVSISIDSAGRIIDAIGEGSYGQPMQASHLYTTVRFDARRTLYGRIGDMWGWLCVLAGGGFLGATIVRRLRSARQSHT